MTYFTDYLNKFITSQKKENKQVLIEHLPDKDFYLLIKELFEEKFTFPNFTEKELQFWGELIDELPVKLSKEQRTQFFNYIFAPLLEKIMNYFAQNNPEVFNLLTKDKQYFDDWVIDTFNKVWWFFLNYLTFIIEQETEFFYDTVLSASKLDFDPKIEAKKFIKDEFKELLKNTEKK